MRFPRLKDLRGYGIVLRVYENKDIVRSAFGIQPDAVTSYLVGIAALKITVSVEQKYLRCSGIILFGGSQGYIYRCG